MHLGKDRVFVVLKIKTKYSFLPSVFQWIKFPSFPQKIIYPQNKIIKTVVTLLHGKTLPENFILPLLVCNDVRGLLNLCCF
ncbi:MAG: hypothetical protein CVU43_21700 [Chloroflexi bacterium HGW-Chloroflexi-5]|jgi:hypothetical protein|nr:MAG: hypothetical protein CVU43_21700 [Chloroflexi bacterium HGW-Chloroflexi-5]